MPIAPDGTPLPYPEDEGYGEFEDEEVDASPAGILRQLLEGVSLYKQVETDDEDIMAIERVSSLIQSILANQQREQDGLLKGKVTPRALRRAA